MENKCKYWIPELEKLADLHITSNEFKQLAEKLYGCRMKGIKRVKHFERCRKRGGLDD